MILRDLKGTIMSRYHLILSSLLMSILVLHGCSKDETTGPPPQNGAPSVPTNPIPANNATAQPLSLTLYWDICTDPENDTVTYDVYFDTLQSPSLAASNRTSTNHGPGALARGTTYYWRVVAKDNRGNSKSGPVWNFVTSAGPPTPILTSPANGVTNVANPPTLVWGASAGASRYTVQVSASESFATLAYGDSNVMSTSQEVLGLSNRTTYYWRVRTSNSYGTSGWSTPTWQFATGSACPGTPTVTYAGKVYTTIQIGTQCWLRENLDVGTMVTGSQNQTNNGTIEKYCYNDNPSNCDNNGGLYQWDEAMQYVTTQGTGGICPPAWHIPTLAEFLTLYLAVEGDGNALKRADQGSGAGQGTNASSFSALLAGSRDNSSGFYYLGYRGYFWSSTQFDASDARALYLNSLDAGIGLYSYFKSDGFSLRCVKD
jgi:uncharacterized protein (TIGR02145 family)